MNKKIDKVKLFTKIISSLEMVSNFIFTMTVPIIMYFKNPDIEVSFLIYIILAIFTVLLGWSMFLYFWSLQMLNKILFIIKDEGFEVSDSIINPSKIEFIKKQKQFILKIKAFSARDTTLIVRPKIPEDSTNSINKEPYARYKNIEQIRPILQSMNNL